MKHSMNVIAASIVALTLPAEANTKQPGLEYEMTIEDGRTSFTVEIQSWSWGATRCDPDCIAARAKREEPGKSTTRTEELELQDLHFVMMQSPNSARLLGVMMANKTMPRVTVRIKQPANQTFELAIKQATVSSFQTGGSGGGHGFGPMEQLSIAFKTAKLTVGTGSDTHTTDIKRN